MTAAAQDPSLSTPLLLSDAAEDAGASRARMQTAASDCKLQDKCFLSVGASESSDAYKKVQRKLVIACILCFIFMIIEVVGGYIAKSVAIMSDAAHMLSDVSAFLVSIFATWAATQPSSWHYSFGYHRAEILGALVSVLAIWAVTGALVFEAVQRTINPVRVDGKLMFFISVAGVVFNVLVALTLGVHAHLGHSHGPDGGCSGHGHSHDHSHGHSSSKHNHSRGHGCGHAHGHDHKHGSGSSTHNHMHEHKHGDHAHEHSHQQQHKHNDDAQEEHSHHCHSHSHASSSGSSSCSSSAADLGSQQGGQATTAAWTAAAEADAGAGAGAGDVIVIDLPAGPAAGGPNCGLVGHAVSCRCTIARKSSHEIEVRCELPPPGVVLKAPAAGAGAAAGAAGGPSRPPSSHSHGHGHGHSHEAGSINLRSAVLHVIGDILQSIGVAIAGGLIWLNQDDPRWYLADPICTFIFSVVVLLTTKSILRDIVHVLMERTPVGVDVPAMSQVISDMAGVRDVHDLHVWNISTSTSPVLTAHVHIGPDADANTVLQQLEQYVRGIGIQHSTIQICNPLQSGPGQQES